MRNAGATLRDIAATLNNAEVKTRRGGKWGPSQVSNLIKRIVRIQDADQQNQHELFPEPSEPSKEKKNK